MCRNTRAEHLTLTSVAYRVISQLGDARADPLSDERAAVAPRIRPEKTRRHTSCVRVFLAGVSETRLIGWWKAQHQFVFFRSQIGIK